jgi:hypothetical protein
MDALLRRAVERRDREQDERMRLLELAPGRPKAERRRGRPPLADGQCKSKLLSIRVSPEEHAALSHAADRSDMDLAAWARRILTQAAKTRP